jgi:hypothetical protein
VLRGVFNKKRQRPWWTLPYMMPLAGLKGYHVFRLQPGAYLSGLTYILQAALAGDTQLLTK